MTRSLFSNRRVALVPTVLAVLALVAALAVALFGAAPVAAQDEVTVEIIDFTFNPGSLEIEAGDIVTWVNNDTAPHTATGDAGEFDTGRLEPGESASIAFNEAGTFTYHCDIHPDMIASVSVVDSSGDSDGGDTTDDGSTDETTTTSVPSTGVGSAFGTSESSSLEMALLMLAGALGATGLLLRRQAAR